MPLKSALIKGALAALREEPREQKMLQGFYRGFAGEGGANPDVFVSPQKRVADYYAAKRAAQTGGEPHAEMVLADPFAGRAYGHSTPGSGRDEPLFTRARKMHESDVQGRTQLYADGGAVTADHTQPDMADGGALIADPNLYADGGAVTGFFPHMKARRSRQDREAAKDMPVAAARGALAGVLGAPGDIESLVRMLPGLDESRTFLPTSEDIERRLPLREASASPAGKAATGLGTLAGGFYTGPGAPVRLVGALPGALRHGAGEFAAAAGQSGPNVIKNKGGNWLAGSVERAIEPMRVKVRTEGVNGHTAENTATDTAINRWLESKLAKYIRNEMGTEQDPLRALALRGITPLPAEDLAYGSMFVPEDLASARKAAGFPEEGVILSKHPDTQDPVLQAAAGWENTADKAFDIMKAGEYAKSKSKAVKAQLAANPWISKLDPNEPVYSPRKYFFPSDFGFDHILDVLKADIAAGRINSEQLSKITMEQAVRRAHEHDLELARKMEQSNLASREGLPVFKEYPEGYRWVELNRPGAFTSESEAMGHSLRGYEPPKGHPDWIENSGQEGHLSYGHGGWEGIKSGRAKVYSLVDAKGQPHVTVEARRGATTGDSMEDMDGLLGSLSAAERKKFNQFLGSDDYYGDFSEAVNWLQENMPTAYQKYMSSMPNTYEITQIKGKLNKAPKEEYLPFVQDFVRSSGHDVAGDFGNTGLYSVDPASDLAMKLKAAGRDIPRYVNDEELSQLHKEFPPEYAGGGSVKTGVKEGVDLLRRSLFGLKPSQEMAGRELVPVQRDLDRMQAELRKAEKGAPKVEERTVSIDPGRGSAKVTDVVQKVAETPVSRRTILKSATGQALQHALPAHSFADLMKPVEVAKEAAKVVAPVGSASAVVPGLMAKALKMGLDEDAAIQYVAKNLPKGLSGADDFDIGTMHYLMRNPHEYIAEGADKWTDLPPTRLNVISDFLQQPTGESPYSIRGALRNVMRENPEVYKDLKQNAQDIVQYGFED